MVAIFSDKREFIFKAVADMYTDVATHPEKTFHFPTGRLACLFVGYPGHQLDLLPATAPESFAGSLPFAASVIARRRHSRRRFRLGHRTLIAARSPARAARCAPWT
jgi:hypothetical protein